jgi:hypothetical protein
MSSIIEVFKDVMERGLEFSSVHKLLHMASKFIFLLFLIQLVAVFSRFLGISLSLSSALPSNTYSLSFLALVLVLLSIGLNYYKKVAFLVFSSRVSHLQTLLILVSIFHVKKVLISLQLNMLLRGLLHEFSTIRLSRSCIGRSPGES